MVSVQFPGGVPELGGGVLLPEPPQATKLAANKAKASKPKASFTRRFFAERRSERVQANSAPAPGINQRGGLNMRNAVEGAVVATTMFTDPEDVLETVNELALSVQVVSVIPLGTAQATLTVPLNPPSEPAEITVSPDWPGVREKFPGLALSWKSAVLEMLIESGDDVEVP
jgi:hypothetical protein